MRPFVRFDEPNSGVAQVRFDGFTLDRVSDGIGLTSDGKLLSWGPTATLGRDVSLGESSPAALIPDLAEVTAFDVHARSACAVADGVLQCWGEVSYGRGVPGKQVAPMVASLPNLDATTRPQQISVAAQTTCVRLSSGTVRCTGKNDFGQLGTGTASSAASYSFEINTVLAPTDHVVQVAVTNSSTGAPRYLSTAAVCALLKTGVVRCWGANPNGELGSGSADQDPHTTATTVAFQAN